MLTNTEKPIQFIIAGKAHPADGPGKDIIRQLVHFANSSQACGRIVFLENYDINVARYLVQGCDVWLNTPRRGMEASGTSGMKAALNGVLNCSILDGWWDEAHASDLGWGIGRGETYTNVEKQDQIESQSLYDLLEKQIVPMFYDRDPHQVPRNWVQRMKNCIAALAPIFNTNRMVRQYTQKLYIPAARRAEELAKDNHKNAIELAHFKQYLHKHWNSIRIEKVSVPQGNSLSVSESLDVQVTVNLADLSPEDVQVQVFTGPIDSDGRIISGHAAMMLRREDLGDGRYHFTGSISTTTSGRFGFAVRIVPGGRMLGDITEPGLILWDTDTPPPVIEQTLQSTVISA
jgi:starch phosphorylase